MPITDARVWEISKIVFKFYAKKKEEKKGNRIEWNWTEAWTKRQQEQTLNIQTNEIKIGDEQTRRKVKQRMEWNGK